MNALPTSEQLVIVWEYAIAPGREEEFALMYGPEGEWVKLFGEASGYIRTDLLIDKQDSSRAVVLDWWESREAYQLFLHEYKAEYDELNARVGILNSAESCLGWFIRDADSPRQEN